MRAAIAQLAAVKPLDVFHMELWGCIEAYKTPKQPAAEVPEWIKSTTETENEEPSAENKEPEPPVEEAIVEYNNRELAVKFEQVAAVRPAVLGRPEVITEDDAKRQLDSDMAHLTADEKSHLAILYRPQMLRATVEHIAEEIARLPPKETIHWMTRRPDPLVVYKWMPLQRKLEWLLHRAPDAELEKTADHFPAFLGFFRDLAPMADAKNRLRHAQELWEQWTGQPIRQRSLPKELQDKIRQVSLGRAEEFCANCAQPLHHKKPFGEVCSEACGKAVCGQCRGPKESCFDGYRGLGEVQLR